MIAIVKLTIKLFLALLLTILIGLFLLVITINNVDYRPQIIAIIDKHTNYKLDIKGKIKYSVLPHIGIYAEDIIITPKNSSQKLLEAKELHINMGAVKYLLSKIRGNNENSVWLKLDSTMLYGLNTQTTITSKLYISLLPHVTIKGTIQLLPKAYQHNPLAIPLTINVLFSPIEHSWSINQQQIDMQLINQLLTENIFISGSSDIQAKLFITNNKQNSDLLHNLSGQIKMVIHDGKIHGVDIFNVLVYTEHQLHSLFDTIRNNLKQNISALLAKNQEPLKEIGENHASLFTKLTIDADLQNGIANNSAITLQHPSYAVQGAGTINLPNNTIDYNINAALTKLDTADPRQVAEYIKSSPIFIKAQGPLNKPNFMVNTTEYLKNGLQQLQKSLLPNILSAP